MSDNGADHPFASSSRSYASITASGDARQHNGDNYWRNTYTLRQRRSDETLRDDQRSPLLLKAAAEGQTVRIKHLLELGVNLDFSDAEGLTALHHAILSGFEDAVRAILAAGADVNAECDTFGPPLCVAAYKARETIVDILLEHRASIRGFGNGLGSPLHSGCRSGDAAIVKKLIKEGAGVSEWRRWNLVRHPPFDPSFLHGELARVASIEDWMCQPLHIAVCSNRLDVMEYLLEHDAEVNGLSQSSSLPGSTPLMLAAAFGSVEAVELLMNYGAGTSIKTSDGVLTVLTHAAYYGQTDVIRYMINDVEIDEQDGFGETALIVAASQGHAECVYLLLNMGCKLDIKNISGKTALFAAIEGSHMRTAKELLAAGADCNVASDDGKYPLDLALDRGLHEIAQDLARKQASVSTKSPRYSLIRLLHTATLTFETFAIFDHSVPPPEYATLSCICEDQEITFQEFENTEQNQRRKPETFKHATPSHSRLLRLCKEASRYSIGKIWCSALCVDWTSQDELKAPVKYFMSWFRNAKASFVYLHDLRDPTTSTLESGLRSCKWLQRSWSLQELLANEAESTHFFNNDWKYVGTRKTLTDTLSRIINIRPMHLRNYANACVAAKLSWGAGLQAFVGENRSYAMLGILGIQLDTQYGEGEESAFQRLQECVIQQIADETIFGWTVLPRAECGLLAASIESFRGCGDLALKEIRSRDKDRFKVVLGRDRDSRGVQARLAKAPRLPGSTQKLLILQCWRAKSWDSDDIGNSVLCIPIRKDRANLGIYKRCAGPEGKLYWLDETSLPDLSFAFSGETIFVPT